MVDVSSLYQEKLTTPQDAVAGIPRRGNLSFCPVPWLTEPIMLLWKATHSSALPQANLTVDTIETVSCPDRGSTVSRSLCRMDRSETL